MHTHYPLIADEKAVINFNPIVKNQELRCIDHDPVTGQYLLLVNTSACTQKMVLLQSDTRTILNESSEITNLYSLQFLTHNLILGYKLRAYSFYSRFHLLQLDEMKSCSDFTIISHDPFIFLVNDQDYWEPSLKQYKAGAVCLIKVITGEKDSDFRLERLATLTHADLFANPNPTLYLRCVTSIVRLPDNEVAIGYDYNTDRKTITHIKIYAIASNQFIFKYLLDFTWPDYAIIDMSLLNNKHLGITIKEDNGNCHFYVFEKKGEKWKQVFNRSSPIRIGRYYISLPIPYIGVPRGDSFENGHDILDLQTGHILPHSFMQRPPSLHWLENQKHFYFPIGPNQYIRVGCASEFEFEMELLTLLRENPTLRSFPPGLLPLIVAFACLPLFRAEHEDIPAQKLLIRENSEEKINHASSSACQVKPTTLSIKTPQTKSVSGVSASTGSLFYSSASMHKVKNKPLGFEKKKSSTICHRVNHFFQEAREGYTLCVQDIGVLPLAISIGKELITRLK